MLESKIHFDFGHVVRSTVSGYEYIVGNLLGEGAFGKAFGAGMRLNPVMQPTPVCLKVTDDAESWHRESYFGELLKRSRQAIQTFDSFPLLPGKIGPRKVMYCLALELAEHGTIEKHLEKTGKWNPKRAVSQVCSLLKLVDELHGGGATHRDITPMNVFVCRNEILKLGDFGIARHQLAGKPKTIGTFNPGFVSTEILNGKQRYWMPTDDVFQMGQLLAMLLCGKGDEIIPFSKVKTLGCGEKLKAIIGQAIGPRKHRFSDAFEMLEALRGRAEAPQPSIRSFAGKTVVFTGPLSISRFDADLLVRQAGGIVARHISRKVDVVVQGGWSPNYKKGHKGRKLIQVEKLIKEGHPIQIIGQAEFRRLVRNGR